MEEVEPWLPNADPGKKGGLGNSSPAIVLWVRGVTRDSLLCAFRRVRGVAGASGGFKFRTCDDFNMAALTVESMVASLGRRVEGI